MIATSRRGAAVTAVVGVVAVALVLSGQPSGSRSGASSSGGQQVDSLQAQINDADASISGDQATLRTLGHQISFTEVSVAINAVAIPPLVSHSGGFTIGKGAHDAGRVLMVVAGVGLIVLACAGRAAGRAWVVVGSALRRRRREQALDLA